MTYDEIEAWEQVYSKMTQEGFHYCFKHYSDFDDIDDIEFHKLRLSYLKAADKLEKYIKAKITEIDNYNVDPD